MMFVVTNPQVPNPKIKVEVEMDAERWENLRVVMLDFAENAYSWHDNPLEVETRLEDIAGRLGFTNGFRCSLEQVESIPPVDSHTLPVH